MAASAGFQVVISLTPSTSQKALSDEQTIVECLGLRYLSIPVNHDRPTRTNLVAFFETMESLTETPTFIHPLHRRFKCGHLPALFRVLRRSWPIAEAIARTHDSGEPNPVWRMFLDRRLPERFTAKAVNRGVVILTSSVDCLFTTGGCTPLQFKVRALLRTGRMKRPWTEWICLMTPNLLSL